ncbi:MAG: hypothetical protein V4641_31395 [Pseudomonadota bacterium]
MHPDDFDAFAEILDLTYDMIGVGAGKIISGPAKAMFFQDLQRYPLDLITASLAAHRADPERGKFTPKVADIVYQIERRRKVSWLSADEAWSQVPKIEGQPGLMNDVTAQALAVAQQFLALPRPDMTAARMAFKGCYDRLVERAKLERRGPEYFVSPGGSYEEQQAVIQEGVRQGLLTAPRAEAVPLLETTKRTPGAKPDLKALLLTLKPKELPPPERQDYE